MYCYKTKQNITHNKTPIWSAENVNKNKCYSLPIFHTIPQKLADDILKSFRRRVIKAKTTVLPTKYDWLSKKRNKVNLMSETHNHCRWLKWIRVKIVISVSMMGFLYMWIWIYRHEADMFVCYYASWSCFRQT